MLSSDYLKKHTIKNISLVFGLQISKGMKKGLYPLNIFIDEKRVWISEKELIPTNYMGEDLYDYYSKFLGGNTQTLIEKLKLSCEGRQESMYMMALILEGKYIVVDSEYPEKVIVNFLDCK